jgi:hypothetical protein
VVGARALVAGEAHQDKVHALDPSGDLEDPIGMGQNAYDTLASRMERVLPERLASLL